MFSRIKAIQKFGFDGIFFRCNRIKIRLLKLPYPDIMLLMINPSHIASMVKSSIGAIDDFVMMSRYKYDQKTDTIVVDIMVKKSIAATVLQEKLSDNLNLYAVVELL